MSEELRPGSYLQSFAQTYLIYDRNLSLSGSVTERVLEEEE